MNKNTLKNKSLPIKSKEICEKNTLKNKSLPIKAKEICERYQSVIESWKNGTDPFERALAATLIEAALQEECPDER